MLNRTCIALLLPILLASCGTEPTPFEDVTQASAIRPAALAARPMPVISDGRTDGSPAFYFLFPIVAERAPHAQPFDQDAAPTVTICRLVSGSCAEIVAEFPYSDGAGASLSTVRQWSNLEFYIATWVTPRTKAGERYRATVTARRNVMGFADIQLVRRLPDLRFVPRDVVGVVAGWPLPIRFRIERGAAQATPLASLQLLFADLDASNNLRIYSMQGDGSNRQYLNVGTGPTQRGDLILARGAYQDNAIYAMDGTGGNRHQILGPGPSYSPDLSPDGQSFTLMYGDCAGGHPIATARSNGTALTVLPICATQVPRWSPLGDRLAYSYGTTLYTVKVDGSDIRPVASFPGVLAGQAWSPDGTALVFSWRPVTAANFGIYRIKVDGTGLQQITNVPADDFVQDWSPTGDWLAAFSTRSGSLALWGIRVDGSEPTTISAGTAQPDAVRWKR